MASSPEYGHTTGFVPDARHLRGAGLLLFDLDDTIVQSGSYVSPRVIGALKAAHDAGFVLAIASGRPYCIVNKRILKTGVMDYCICANGAEVTLADDGTCLCKSPLSQKDALDCYGLVAKAKPAWNGFFGGRAYFEMKGASYMLTGRSGATARALRSQGEGIFFPKRLAYVMRRGAVMVLRILTNRDHRQVLSILPHLRKAYDGVEKLGCSIPNRDRCAEAARVLEADGRFEVVRMGETELEITRRGVTKGTGARLLMDALGIDADHAVAFGDGGNDLPLLEAVGRFVAVGNADQEVKDRATEVCETVADDGVARWIERMLARGGLEQLGDAHQGEQPSTAQ